MHDKHSPNEVAAHRLAELLGSNTDEVITAIGGPWNEARFDGDHKRTDAAMFVGRAGPSVAILIDPAIRAIRIGKAEGEWSGVAELIWRISEPKCTFPLGTPVADTDLVQAVDDAFAAKRSSLHICRSCGEITAPERAFGSETCMGCSSRYLGVLY
jgi:hypothetical protein